MSYRLAVALTSLLAASNAFASIIFLPNSLPRCPSANYVAGHQKVVNNLGLAEFNGPTPAGADPRKCGITPISRSTPGYCPSAQTNFAFDVFDFWGAANPPINRTFREELNVNTFSGIPIGERLKISELKFSNGETLSLYFERSYSTFGDLVAGFVACESGCAEQELSRFNFPAGLPEDQAVPLTISWSTGRYNYGNALEISWSIANAPPFNASNYGNVLLGAGTREYLFSNGIVQSSCNGSNTTVVRFISPRFE